MLETVPGEGHNAKNNCEEIMKNYIQKIQSISHFVQIKSKSTLKWKGSLLK